MYDLRRKYWGAFCPLHQPYKTYIHVVYPVSRGLIRNIDGTIRPMTPEELDLHYEDTYDHGLVSSFKMEEN